jgi:hypothetical protein
MISLRIPWAPTAHMLSRNIRRAKSYVLLVLLLYQCYLLPTLPKPREDEPPKEGGL